MHACPIPPPHTCMHGVRATRSWIGANLQVCVILSRVRVRVGVRTIFLSVDPGIELLLGLGLGLRLGLRLGC